MADEPKVSMLREVVLGLDRMVAVAVAAICLPARASRMLHEGYGSRQRYFWTIAISVAAIALGFLTYGLYGLALNEHWTNWEKQVNTMSALVRNAGLLIAGLVGVGFGIWRAYTGFLQTKTAQQQAYTAEQGQITDRYSKAVEMLSNENARTRVGAVYALARIAQDSVARDHIPVMEVLGEFLRNSPYHNKTEERVITLLDQPNTEQSANGAGADSALPPIQCPDVLTALNVIGARNQAQRAHERRIDFVLSLEGANLGNFDLARANLESLYLFRADLSNANLSDADLRAAFLSDADLRAAFLSGANLRGADLSDADLSDANLSGADLSPDISPIEFSGAI
jgi:hypothetical protein